MVKYLRVGGWIYKLASKLVMYHGTATGENGEILRQILKKGLDPDPAKRVFEEGEMETLGGVYLTGDATDAVSFCTGAVKAHGGDRLILAVQVETRSPEASVDEDMLFSGRDHYLDHYWRDTLGRTATEWGVLVSLEEDSINWGDVADHFFENKILHYWPSTSLKRLTAIRPLLANALEAQTIWWLSKWYDYNKESAVAFQEVKMYEKLVGLSESAAKSDYYRKVDTALRKLKEATEPRKKGWMHHRIRFLEPINYRGANRILCVLRWNYTPRESNSPYYVVGRVEYGSDQAAMGIIEGMRPMMSSHMYFEGRDGTPIYDEAELKAASVKFHDRVGANPKLDLAYQDLANELISRFVALVGGKSIRELLADGVVEEKGDGVFYDLDASNLTKYISPAQLVFRLHPANRWKHPYSAYFETGDPSFIGLPLVVYSEEQKGSAVQPLSREMEEQLFHELIHFLDAQRWKGQGEVGPTYDVKEVEESPEKYVNDPWEFNAFFQQGANRIQEEMEKSLKPGPYSLTLEDLVEAHFDNGFASWKSWGWPLSFFNKGFLSLLDSKYQRKFDKRLYQLWVELKQRYTGNN